MIWKKKDGPLCAYHFDFDFEISPLPGLCREHHYIAFDEYYNEPIGRSFGNCEIPFVTS